MPRARPPRPWRRAVARRPQALQHCEPRDQARRSPRGGEAASLQPRGHSGPQAALGLRMGPRADCATGKRNRLRTPGHAANAQTRKPPAARTDIGQGGSDFVTGDEGFSDGGPGGPEGRPPCGDLGEVPIPGTWGRSPNRGPGEVPVGERPWGNGRGVGETRPPRGEEGTKGNGGQGEAPHRGEEGGFPRPVTGARAGKLVLPRPA